jgi:hypothetical protein
MRLLSLTVLALLTSGMAATAGVIIPMPSAGLIGPVALVAAVGAVIGAKYLRRKR